MGKGKPSAEVTISSIHWKMRRKYSAKEKIRIVLERLRGKESIAELCRRDGIGESLYYSWSKEFYERSASHQDPVYPHTA